METGESGMEKILEVTGVQLEVLESFPPKLRITASGTVRTGGWSNPALMPHIHIQPPPDGIYGFDFVANPPEEVATQVISPIEVTDRWENLPEDVKGVRIHASNNSETALLDRGETGREPNRFIFNDCDSTRIEFFPQALTPLGTSETPGEASLEYTGPEGHAIFRGEQITQQETVLGSLISVTLRTNIADEGNLDLALVLPPVDLGGEARQEFATLGILIRGLGFVADRSGAQLKYEILELKGTAEYIPVL